MLLSDQEIEKRRVGDSEVDAAKEWWEQGDWSTIADRLLIDPYDPHHLSACSYDLSIGEEYVSLRDPDTVRTLGSGEILSVGPGETVLILTREYVCLPNTLMAAIVPKARWIFEGTSVYASKVDPTWYGKLLVGFANHGKGRVPLRYGEPIISCYFLACAEVGTALSKATTPGLGRTQIEVPVQKHVRAEKLLRPDQVSLAELRGVVDRHGVPFDIIEGAILRVKDETITYFEKDIYQNVLEDAVRESTKRAYDQQLEIMRQHQDSTRQLLEMILQQQQNMQQLAERSGGFQRRLFIALVVALFTAILSPPLATLVLQLLPGR